MVYKVEDWLCVRNKATPGSFYLVRMLKKHKDHRCPGTGRFKEEGDFVEMQKGHSHDKEAYEDYVCG